MYYNDQLVLVVDVESWVTDHHLISIYISYSKTFDFWGDNTVCRGLPQKPDRQENLQLSQR